ncbi:MAG: hypothetical protein GY870_11520 [archaeon]|nr:hypothetical protein [archaeon]
MFKFLVSRTAKLVGRSVDSVFFTSLYREIFKEVLAITKDETQAAKIVKNIGIKGTQESCQRQATVMRLFPDDPKKILGYLDIIFEIIFGTKIDEYERIEKKIEGSIYPDISFKISKCPICGGYGSLPEDSIDCNKIHSNESNYASGLMGMIQETVNFILREKAHDYRVEVSETKCFCRGDDCFEIYCHIMPKEEFGEVSEGLEENIGKKSSFNIDLDKIEEILTKPLDSIKEEVSKLVNEKLKMSTQEFLDNFRNYEEDVIRIFGFLLVHGVNEAGRLIEEFLKNETYSRIVGHLFKNMVEMTKFYMPREVLRDYRDLLVEFVTDLAPDEMVENFKAIEAQDMSNLFYEGMEKALIDLGVNFEGLKNNIWEELEFNKAIDVIPIKKPDENASEDEKIRVSQIKMKMFQEVFMLLNAIMSLPSKILISTVHSSTKSVAESSGDLFANIREHADKLFDLSDQLK